MTRGRRQVRAGAGSVPTDRQFTGQILDGTGLYQTATLRQKRKSPLGVPGANVMAGGRYGTVRGTVSIPLLEKLLKHVDK